MSEDELAADEVRRMSDWARTRAIHPLDIQDPDTCEAMRKALKAKGLTHIGLVPIDHADLRGSYFVMSTGRIWYAKRADGDLPTVVLEDY